MGQLKHNAEHQTLNERGEKKTRKDNPPGMNHQRDRQRQREKDNLSSGKRDQIPTARPDNTMVPDSPRKDVPEVAIELPLERKKSVQYPKVNVLEAMKPEPLLMGR